MEEWHILNHHAVLLKVQVEAGGDGVNAFFLTGTEILINYSLSSEVVIIIMLHVL